MKPYIKLFLTIVCVGGLITPENSFGKADFIVGKWGNCLGVDTGGGKSDHLFFCGKTSKYCESDTNIVKNNSGDAVHSYNHHGHFRVGEYMENSELQDVYAKSVYYCCGGTSDKEGKFVNITKIRNEHPDWGMFRAGELRSNRKSLGNGAFCTQIVYDDVCGGVGVKDDCYTPDSCDNGLVLLNGNCVKPCDDGYGFGDESGTCVPCETTTQQGVMDGTCVKCKSDEFFDIESAQEMQDSGFNTVDSKKDACIPYSSVTQLTQTAHDTCWLCSTAQNLKLCMQVVSRDGHLAKPTYAGDGQKSDTVVDASNANLSTLLDKNGKFISQTLSISEETNPNSPRYKGMYEDCTIKDQETTNNQ